MSETKTVPLYRIENPDIQAHPDGVTSHKDLVGQWFTPNLDSTTAYLKKSTQTFGKEVKPVEGAQLVVARVPERDLDKYHVSQHSVASTMDVEGDNYILPRDGSIDTRTIGLDETLGDLRGQLGRFDKLMEARQKVAEKVGELELEQVA